MVGRIVKPASSSRLISSPSTPVFIRNLNGAVAPSGALQVQVNRVSVYATDVEYTRTSNHNMVNAIAGNLHTGQSGFASIAQTGLWTNNGARAAGITSNTAAAYTGTSALVSFNINALAASDTADYIMLAYQSPAAASG